MKFNIDRVVYTVDTDITVSASMSYKVNNDILDIGQVSILPLGNKQGQINIDLNVYTEEEPNKISPYVLEGQNIELIIKVGEDEYSEDIEIPYKPLSTDIQERVGSNTPIIDIPKDTGIVGKFIPSLPDYGVLQVSPNVEVNFGGNVITKKEIPTIGIFNEGQEAYVISNIQDSILTNTKSTLGFSIRLEPSHSSNAILLSSDNLQITLEQDNIRYKRIGTQINQASVKKLSSNKTYHIFLIKDSQNTSIKIYDGASLYESMQIVNDPAYVSIGFPINYMSSAVGINYMNFYYGAGTQQNDIDAIRTFQYANIDFQIDGMSESINNQYVYNSNGTLRLFLGNQTNNGIYTLVMGNVTLGTIHNQFSIANTFTLEGKPEQLDEYFVKTSPRTLYNENEIILEDEVTYYSKPIVGYGTTTLFLDKELGNKIKVYNQYNNVEIGIEIDEDNNCYSVYGEQRVFHSKLSTNEVILAMTFDNKGMKVNINQVQKDNNFQIPNEYGRLCIQREVAEKFYKTFISSIAHIPSQGQLQKVDLPINKTIYKIN